MNEEGSDINTILPHEIISIILNEGDDKSVVHCRRVCKLWHSCLRHRWKNRKPSSTPRLLKVFGKQGQAQGEFNYPSGIAIDSKGNIYVADTDNNRIQVFNPEGEFIRQWGEAGDGNGQFSSLWTIAIDGNDNIIVSDTNNHRVQVFDLEGKFLHKIESEGVNAQFRFSCPDGIVWDKQLNILFIVDSGNHSIKVFDHEGNFLRKWGEFGHDDSQFNDPRGITFDKQGNLHIVEWNNNRIQVFNKEGHFIRKWGEEEAQFQYPYGIAIDKLGNIFVSDFGNNRIQIFDQNEQFVCQWNHGGNEELQFNMPTSITVVSDQRILIVVDKGNHRIQILSY